MSACARCGRANPADARFCVGCGAALVTNCPHCGAALVPDGKFCPGCGAPAGEPQPAIEMIKLVTILFADVVGSTAMEESMPPEDARALLAEFFEAMSEEIRAEGGTVERLIGDAIMADFGVPVAHEDDPVRAVSAARRMFARLQEFNAAKHENRRIQMRIGINTGEVSTGGSMGQQLLVMGDAVNVAARLEQTAEPGTIVIGERTARAVRKEFALDRRDDLVLKGKRSGGYAYRVVDELETPAVDSRPTMTASMVGRSGELIVLLDLFKRVQRQRAPHMVTVVGDPGIGKSRLIEEFTGTLEGSATVLTGRCITHGERVALWPFREILRNLGGMRDDSAGTILKKTLRLVKENVPADLAPLPHETAAGLASTVSLQAARDAFERIDPRELQRELISSWKTLLAGLATDGPIVVVIENLYRADDITLELLAGIQEQDLGPVMFVCTARPEFTTSHPGWVARIRNYSTISLAPLQSESVRELAARLLETDEVPERIGSAILERAEGNPFFVEELLHRLIEEGNLRRSGDEWVVDEDLDVNEVPDNVQAVILARLDMLPPGPRELLQKASAVGRAFPADILPRLVDKTHILDHLRELQDRQLIGESLGFSGIEYSFRHVLIRDVAYESLPREPRARAHLAIARWVEEIRGERALDVAELLADHYERAYNDLGDDALRVAARQRHLEAARNAVGRFALAQAEAFGKRAVGLSHEPAERIEALEALGDLYQLSNRGDEAWAAFIEAIDGLRSAEPRPNDSVARIASKAAILATRFQGAIDEPLKPAHVQSIIDLGFDSLSDPASRDAVLLHASRSFFRSAGYSVSDDAAGDLEAERAMEIAQSLGDPDLISVALDAKCSMSMVKTDFSGAYDSTMRRLELADRLTDLSEILDVHAVASYICTYVGRYEEAAEHATTAATRARGVDPGTYWHALMWRVHAKFMLGEWEEALRDQAEIEEHTSVDGGLPHSGAIRGYGITFLIHELRRDPEADRYAQILVEYQKKAARAGLTFAGPLAVPARAMAHGGRFEEARSWLNTDRTIYLGGHLEALCDVVGEQGDWQAAKEIAQLAHEEAESGGLLALPAFIDRLEGRFAATLEDWRSAETHLQRSVEGFEAVSSPWEAAYSRLLLGETRAAAGLDGTREPAARALATFERLRSRCEVDRARALLEQTEA